MLPLHFSHLYKFQFVNFSSNLLYHFPIFFCLIKLNIHSFNHCLPYKFKLWKVSAPTPFSPTEPFPYVTSINFRLSFSMFSFHVVSVTLLEFKKSPLFTLMPFLFSPLTANMSLIRETARKGFPFLTSEGVTSMKILKSQSKWIRWIIAIFKCNFYYFLICFTNLLCRFSQFSCSPFNSIVTVPKYYFPIKAVQNLYVLFNL